jgi:hypothetical protein
MRKYYFTRDEYINNYEQMLASFLSLHVDNDVEDFIQMQISDYKYALNFINFIVFPARHEKLPFPIDLNLFWNLMEYFGITNHKITNYKDFSDSFENKRIHNLTKIFFDKKYKWLINSWKKIILFLEKDEKDKQTIIRGSQKTSSTTNQIYDNNNFNEKGFNLFLYLVENYTDKGEKKIKYINLYYYLKNELVKDDSKNKLYLFNFTQEKYKEYILNKYSIEIKKFEKAAYDFDVQKSILNALEQNFRSLD